MPTLLRRVIALFELVTSAMLLAACGGGSGGGGPPHSVGGTVSGLTGSGLVLLDNGGGSLPVAASGSFTFGTMVPDGGPYSVTVSSQPTKPSQTCTVAHGSGTISGSDVTNVAVTCTTNSFTIGGTIAGLAGNGLVLSENGTNKAISALGPFTLAPPLLSGTSYAVTVATQPSGPPQTCTVSNGTGTVEASNIASVSVMCTTNTYAVGAYVSGLVGSGLTLSYNGGAPMAISRNGYSAAATGLSTGTSYAMTLVSQPTDPAQTCTLSNGSGTVGTSNVTSIMVFCPQAAGQYAYVVTQGNNLEQSTVLGAISAYSIDPASGALTLVPGSTVTTGPEVNSLQFVPRSSFVWALNVGNVESDSFFSSSIYSYTLNTSTGLLTAVTGSPFGALNGTGSTPAACEDGMSGYGLNEGVTFAPDGLFGFAANGAQMVQNNTGFWSFTIDLSTGAPSALGTPAPGVCGNSSPSPVSIDPSGQFAYMAGYPSAPQLVDNDPTDLFAFTIDSTTGALTPVPGGPYNDRNAGEALSIDPAGRFAYQLDGDYIWAFSINPFSGALTAVAGSPFTYTSAATSMAIEPQGLFAYVARQNGLYAYSIDAATGAFSPVGNPVTLQIPSASVGGDVGALLIDPSGQFAYLTANVAAGQWGIYAYVINTATGALTAVSGNPFVSGSSYPAAMAISN
jgi:lactonase family protein with 7-bladed beta-propeller